MIIRGWAIFRCGQRFRCVLLYRLDVRRGTSGLYGNDTAPSPVLLQQSGVSTVFFVTLIFAVLFSAPIIPWLKNKLESSCTKLALRGAVYCTCRFRTHSASRALVRSARARLTQSVYILRFLIPHQLHRQSALPRSALHFGNPVRRFAEAGKTARARLGSKISAEDAPIGAYISAVCG